MTTNIKEMSARKIQIELVQRAIENGAVAINAFEVGIEAIKLKQASRFRELARQTLAEKEASARHSNS